MKTNVLGFSRSDATYRADVRDEGPQRLGPVLHLLLDAGRELIHRLHQRGPTEVVGATRKSQRAAQQLHTCNKIGVEKVCVGMNLTYVYQPSSAPPAVRLVTFSPVSPLTGTYLQ